MASPVVHVEVRGLDSEELAAFYRDVFGWQPDPELSVDGYPVVRLGTTPVTAGIGPVPDWSANSCAFYIQVDDIDSALQEIESRGGRAVMPRTESPEDFPPRHIRVFTRFVDPAGNVVGLVETPEG